MSKVPGEAIRKIRHYKSYMQKEAAHRLGITQQAYSLLERSISIKCKTVCNILEAFDCTPEDFEKINGYPPRYRRINKVVYVWLMSARAMSFLHLSVYCLNFFNAKIAVKKICIE